MSEATPSADKDAGSIGIAAVERDTGLSKDTLRVWERRYGFPLPQRDGSGDRVYSNEQVQRLRLLRRLLDAGHRPGRVVPASLEALELLLQERPHVLAPRRQDSASAAVSAGASQVEEMKVCLRLLREHQVDEFRRHLAQSLMRQGLSGFVKSVVAPLTRLVGESWMRGELEVFEEHIYTETVKQLLRQAMQTVSAQLTGGRPRVLLTTLPGEPHGLGLLMVEALLAVEACQCLSLGVQTPVDELPRAAAAHGSDIVALSFSGLMAASVVRRGLSDARAVLPAQIELWAGGSATLMKRPLTMSGARVITDLAELPRAVAQWRAARLKAG
ncbi:MerR family transcriptional regulator [Roseateles oligotrophus]|uniref:MerR family transcriptional regulator n=1 Tax=Roseateles oligotrophus TaxID=1769250 RepID=A0ABT2YJV0_9BURK|nr:MerR family transcriptional regulator [Roseateles oligotrophus]MCV2370339.1 MerR family transcriptional regulator [Roseateles oligotrophus]